MLENILKELREFRASIEIRLTALESKQYDTKPIWERALTEVAETRQEMNARFNDLDGRIVILGDDVLKLRAQSVLRPSLGGGFYGRAAYESAPPVKPGTPEEVDPADKKKPS